MGKWQDRVRLYPALKVYASNMRGYHFASLLLIVVVMLTHFSMGSLPVVAGFSYADVVCFAGMVTAVAVLCSRKSLMIPRFRDGSILFVAACAAILFLLMQVSSRLPGWPFVVFGSALATGVYIVLVAVLWFDYFADESMETSAFSLSVCLVGGCLLSWFLLGMSHDRFMVGYVLSIVLAGALLERALRSKEKGIVSFYGLEKKAGSLSLFGESGYFFALLASVFLLCFAAMLSLSYAGTQQWHSNEIWLIVLPSALMISLIALLFDKVEVGALLYVALILGVASVLLSSFFAIDASVLFILATNEITITMSLSILFMLSLAQASKRIPHEMGSLLVLVVFLGCICGRFAGDFALLTPEGSFLRKAIAVAAVIVLIVCVSITLNNKLLAETMRHRFVKSEKRLKDRREIEEHRLKAFADEKSLGAREYEVLCLLAKGCSAREIAEEMFVANGTAKAHIRHVYQKLGVNDRESLLAMVEKVRETGSL